MREVSVVITAYDQAGLIRDAIDSVLAQEGPSREIVVIDDGSSDGTADVARSRAGVTVISQPNRGIAAARVAGIDASTAPYVVLLDGDDRLHPGALVRGVRALEADPRLAFVSGRCVHIDADGSPLPTEIRPPVTRDHYRELLRHAYIYPPGAVMFRRSALDAARPLNTAHHWEVIDDLELYLRLARRHPVADHGDVVVEYRRHAANSAAGHPDRVLRAVLRVLRDERVHTRHDPELERARRAGIAHWQQVFGYEIAAKARACAANREWRAAAQSGAALLRLAWPAVLRALGRKAARRLR